MQGCVASSLILPTVPSTKGSSIARSATAGNMAPKDMVLVVVLDVYPRIKASSLEAAKGKYYALNFKQNITK